MTLTALLESRIVWAMAGALVSLALAYFTFSRDIGNKVSELKGMVSLLLQRLAGIDRLQEKLYGLDKDVERLKYDQNNAFKAIRTIQGGSNGVGSHES